MTGATINLNKAHFPVTALGPGVRIALWTQGCRIGCAGCSALDTWDSAGGREWPAAALLERCAEWIGSGATGVTITGGEPFDQPDALAWLVPAVRALGVVHGVELDVLCYSGRSMRFLEARHGPVLATLDAVISGPYRRGRPSTVPWQGSANQELHVLTELGRARIGAAAPAPHLQLSVQDGRVWMIGVPEPGDLDRLSDRVAELGLELGDVSWRS